MSKKQEMKIYYCWETDIALTPTGRIRVVKARTLRMAIRHIAFTTPGCKISVSRQYALTDDGKKWFGQRIKE